MAFDIGQGIFPLLNQSQTNPIMSGLANGIAMHMNMQNVQKNRQIMPYVGPQAAASLQKQQLANKLSQVLLPYAAPQAQANLQGKQLQNQYYGPEAQAQMGLQGAQTNEAQQSALAQKITNQFLPQQQQAELGLKGAQANYYNMGGGRGGVDVQTVYQIGTQLGKEHKDWTQDQIQDATSQYLKGANTFSDGTPLPPPSGTTTNFVDSANMHTNTAKGTDQINFASMLNDEFDKGDQLTDNAFSYSGIKGSANLLKDQALAASGGTPSPAYQDYKTFTEQVIPGIAADIIRTEGASSTDGQKALAIIQANPIGAKSSPEIAKKQWQELKELYASIGKTAATSLTQKKGQLSGANTGPASSASSPSADPLGIR